MRRLPTFLIFLSCLLGFATDLPEEQFIDAYDDQNQTYGETFARLTYVGKHATVFHEGRVEEPAIRNLPIVSGDLLETGYSSYAELEFIDGSLLQVADRTKLESQAINEVYSDESLTVFRLHEGQIFLHVSDNANFSQNQVFRIDTRAGSSYIEAPGIYMMSYKSGRMVLKTYRGLAELSGEYGSELVHSGQFSSIRGMGRPVNVVAFNSFRGNAFQRWAYDRRPVQQSASARYVDGAIATYSRDLDDHGEWRYNNSYDSHVWVPHRRKAWRPYNNGYWSPISGRLTWISHDPFGYVTHHYGRWGWSLDFGWYWVPGRYYSPAWVAWNTFDSYVGWCPLGYSNRPYYYRNNVYNTVIINNHRTRWNYVSIRDVRSRRAARLDNYRHPRNQARRITTRPISIVSSDLRDGRRVARIIRDPQLNQRRTSERVRNRGLLVSSQRSGRDARTTITRRDSGTRAATRYASTTREVRQQRLRSQGSTLVERSTQTRTRDTVKSRDSTASRRQTNIQRTRRSTESASPRTSTTSRNRTTRSESSTSRSQAPRRQTQGTTRTSPPKQRQRATPPKQQRNTAPNRTRQRQSTESRAPRRQQSTQSQTRQRQSTQRSQSTQRRQSTQRSQPTQRRQSTQRSQSTQRRQSTRSAPPKQRQRATPQPRRSQPRATPPKQRQRTTAKPRTTTKPRTSTRTAKPRRQAPKPKPVPKRDNK